MQPFCLFWGFYFARGAILATPGPGARVHNPRSTMNRLSSILPVAQVLVGLDATSKKRAFEEAGLLFENLHGLSRALVTDSLFARGLDGPGPRGGDPARSHQRAQSPDGGGFLARSADRL
jgi:PTS system nitrogen regulatory IIA component